MSRKIGDPNLPVMRLNTLLIWKRQVILYALKLIKLISFGLESFPMPLPHLQQRLWARHPTPHLWAIVTEKCTMLNGLPFSIMSSWKRTGMESRSSVAMAYGAVFTRGYLLIPQITRKSKLSHHCPNIKLSTF
jgi:hypothetical protein